MAWLNQLLFGQLMLFMLVLARVSGLVMTAPVFGSAEVPARVRALLAVGLSVLITPLYWGLSVPATGDLVQFTILMAAEGLLGVTIGVGVMLLFAGIQIAGQVIGQLSGMQLADVFNPGFDSGVPVFSQLFYLVSLAVFVIIGGHRLVIHSLLDTFRILPPGTGGVSSSLVETMSVLMAQSFSLGVRAAAPAMAALLLATLLLALIGRTLPQLNVMALGFSVNALLTLAVLSVSLGAAALVLQAHIEPTLERLVESVGDAGVRSP